MGWIRIDDTMYAHPLMIAVGTEGFALQVAGVSYANRLRTDGEIPKKVARNLVEMTQPNRTINKLLKHGVWTESEDSYQIVNYLAHQRSKAQIEESSKKQSEAGKRGANRRWSEPENVGSPHSDPNSQKKKKNKKLDVSTNVLTSVEDSSSTTPEIVTLRKEKPRDEIWDAVMYVCRINTAGIAQSARAGYGKVVKELKELGASADDVHQRGAAYRLAYREAPLTPYALLKHWAQVEGVATQPDVSRKDLELEQWAQER